MNSNILAPLALLLVASALLVSSAPASYPSSVDAVVPETGLISAKPASKSALTRKSAAVSSKLSSPAIIVTEAMCCEGLRKAKKTAEDAIEMCKNDANKKAFCIGFTPSTTCELCFQKFCADRATFKTQCAVETKKEVIADNVEKVKQAADIMTRTPRTRNLMLWK